MFKRKKNQERGNDLYPLAFVLLFWALCLALYATIPPSPDQSFFDYTGWMLIHGSKPYTDFIDQNWPGPYWLHAISTALFGANIHSWRIFDFLLTAVVLLFFARFVRTLYGKEAWFWVLVLYPALYIVGGTWFSGQKDIVGAHLLLLSIIFHWKAWENNKITYQAGTGLTLGLAMILKPTLGVAGILLAVHGLLLARNLWEAVSHATLTAISAIMTIILSFCIIIAQGTSPRSLWEAAFLFTLKSYSGDSPGMGEVIRKGFEYASACWHWIIAGAAASLAWMFISGGKKRLAKSLLLPVLALAGLGSFLAQGKGFGYHLGPFFVATVLMVCVGMGALTKKAFPLRMNPFALASFGLLLVPLAGTGIKWHKTLGNSFRYLVGSVSQDKYYSDYHIGDGIKASEALELCSRLRRTIPGNGTFLVWGRAEAVNYLSQIPQPTRFHHNIMLIEAGKEFVPREKWLDWFEEDLKRNNPGGCLVNREELWELKQGNSRATEFLKDYLDDRYVFVKRIGKSNLYMRRDLYPVFMKSNPPASPK